MAAYGVIAAYRYKDDMPLVASDRILNRAYLMTMRRLDAEQIISCGSANRFHMQFLDVRLHIVRGKVEAEPCLKEKVPMPLSTSSGHPPALRSWLVAMVRRMTDVASTTSAALTAKAELVSRMKQVFADEDVVHRVESTTLAPRTLASASPRARNPWTDLWWPLRCHPALWAANINRLIESVLRDPGLTAAWRSLHGGQKKVGVGWKLGYPNLVARALTMHKDIGLLARTSASSSSSTPS